MKPADFEQETERPKLLTLEQVCELYPIKLRTLRYWIQNAAPRLMSRAGQKVELPGNGLAPEIIRIDRIVLIDEMECVAWLNSLRMAPPSN
jgi:hypothetical protein